MVQKDWMEYFTIEGKDYVVGVELYFPFAKPGTGWIVMAFAKSELLMGCPYHQRT